MGYIPSRTFETAEIPDIKVVSNQTKSILKKRSQYKEKKSFFDNKLFILILLIILVLMI